MARTKNVERFDAERGRLLMAAAACFKRHGFQGAGIADICAEAGGISPGRLYHYFPSKQTIVEALVAEERATFGALVAAFRTADDPTEGLLVLVRQSVTLAIEADYGPLAAEIIAESARNPEIARIVQYAERDYREHLIAALARVREADTRAGGATWAARDDDRMARALTMLIDGALARGMLEPACRSRLPSEVEHLVRRLIGADGARR